MGTKTEYGFKLKHDRAWAWHIGINFCVEDKSSYDGKRDVYLLLCLGRHDFSIGFIHEWAADIFA